MKMNRTTRYTDRANGQAAYFASAVFPAGFETTTGMCVLAAASAVAPVTLGAPCCPSWLSAPR